MRRGDFTPLIEEITHFLEPLLVAADDPESAALLLREVGYPPPGEATAFDGLAAALTAVFEVVDTLAELDDVDEPEEYVAPMAELLFRVAGAIGS